MSTKARNNGKRESSEANIFITGGEAFCDGMMIELISGGSALNKPNLLLWNGRKATVGPRVGNGGRIYEAAELSLSLLRAMRLPSQCTDYGSARDLFVAITELFEHHIDLPERDSSLLACFSMGTWLADRLPTAPSLTISGPDPELGIDVLRLLNCVCRHPLMLAEVTPSGLRSLPMELSLTLLLDQPRLRPDVQRLLRASSYRGLYLPVNRGSVADLYGPKAIFCGNDAAVDFVDGGGIHIFLSPCKSQPSELDAQVQNEIANHFQPRLLTYRLKNFEKVRQSQVEVSKLTFTTGRLARTLAMCFPEDLELAGDIVHLLQPQDEDVRLQRANSIECAIVEVLLGFVHEQKLSVMKVGDLADLVNCLLESRGEILAYRAEEVGWKLKGLGVMRHRTSAGSQIQFDRQTSHQVHRLARAYGLALSCIETCRECAVM